MSEIQLNVGDKAPQFTSTDQSGNSISLTDFLGSKVILYFYPKDNTPGCTAEACSFRDEYATLVKMGISVLGVSVDDEKSHLKFASKYELPFPLIADTEKNIVNTYGVWGEKSMYGKKYFGITRKSFVIDEKGMIMHIIDRVDTKNASAQVIELLKK